MHEARQDTARVHLVYAIEGDVDAVDVFALAPTLLSLGSLIQDGSRLLNPAGDRVAVNVRPFRPGSFNVDIVLLAQDPGVQQTIGLAVSAGVIVSALKAIGLIADIKNGAIAAMKALGRKPRAEEIERIGPGEYRYTVGDKSITVDSSVHQLIENSSVVQHIQNIYQAPMNMNNVTSVKSYLADHESDTVVRVTR